MRSRINATSSAETEAKQEFIALRIKMTVIIVGTIAMLFLAFLALTVANEENTRKEAVVRDLVNVTTSYVENEENEGVTDSPVIGSPTMQSPESRMPIALYLADYDNSILTPLDISSARLSDDVMFAGTESFLSAEPSSVLYAKDEDLIGIKLQTDLGDVLAFTNLSTLDTEIQNYTRMLGSLLLVVLMFLTLIMWTLSNWAIGPVKRMWERQRVFIGNASHELKTPLTTMKANLELLVDGKVQDEESKHQSAVRALEETNRMISLVRDLLDLASEKAYSAPQTELSLAKIISRQTLLFEAKAFERGIIINDSELDRSVTVKANEDNIARLIAILLDNACKYASENSSIDVSLVAIHKTAVLKVVNEGTPIPDELRDEIFNRFVRADKARTGQAAKTSYGLGLTMAKDIASASNGYIYACTQEDGRTAFVVELPLVTSVEKQQAHIESSE